MRKEERGIEVRTNDADEILPKLEKLQNGNFDISSDLNGLLANNDKIEKCAMKCPAVIDGILNSELSK